MSDQLSLAKKLSYGVGHVLNDLTASMWFSYLLIYLHRIVRFDDSLSGFMMLLGQVADGVATAFVGFESDRTEKGFCNYGRRKSWHLAGVISILISFPFIFNLCITCENSPMWARFMYYAPFIVIFQFGWAATQISHLSLIPQLTTSENERVALNAIRYAFTVSSNLFVYGMTYLLLRFNTSDNTDDNNLTPGDAPKFMHLTFIICGVGLIFQVIFHTGTNEKNLRNDREISDQTLGSTNQATLNWIGYLKSYQFYTLGVLYMCTRLIVNMTQVYLPMFLTDTISLNKDSIALIPFICYLSGFLSTFPLRYLSRYLGSYITYSIGVVLIMLCSALFWNPYLIDNEFTTSIVTAILLGSGSTIILVTSLALTTNLIGKNTGSGAFVFGCMSFADKLSNGITVALLQNFSPCHSHTDQCSCKDYYQIIMTVLPSSCAIAAFITLLILYSVRPTSQNLNSLLICENEIQDQVQQEEKIEEQEIINKDMSSTYGSINKNL